MVILPYSLTPGEFIAVKNAFKAGMFEPGSCSCRQPRKTMTIKEVARQAGMSYQDFSHLLSNARRKIIFAALGEISSKRGPERGSESTGRRINYQLTLEMG